jgi:hypothetical protein
MHSDNLISEEFFSLILLFTFQIVIHSFFKSISDFLRPKGSTDSQPQREKIKRLFVGVVMKTRNRKKK